MQLETRRPESRLSNRHMRCQWPFKPVQDKTMQAKEEIKYAKCWKYKPLYKSIFFPTNHQQTVYSPRVYVSQSALGVVTQKQCHEWSCGAGNNRIHRLHRWAHARLTGTCIPALKLCVFMLLGEKYIARKCFFTTEQTISRVKGKDIGRLMSHNLNISFCLSLAGLLIRKGGNVCTASWVILRAAAGSYSVFC